jgi:hypothetical protein
MAPPTFFGMWEMFYVPITTNRGYFGLIGLPLGLFLGLFQIFVLKTEFTNNLVEVYGGYQV